MCNKRIKLSGCFLLMVLYSCSSPEVIDLSKANHNTTDYVKDTFHFSSELKPNPLIITDKRVYEKGESIELTISNDSEREIIIKPEAAQISTFMGEVPVPKDTIWAYISLYANINAIILSPGGIDEKKIEPGGRLRYSLVNCKPGKYMISYRINPEGTWAGYRVTSNDFEVK